MKQPSTHARRASTQKGRRDREIMALRRELEAERRRVARLRREVASLREEARRNAGSSARDDPFARLRRRPSAAARLRDSAGHRALHFRERSFIRYLFEVVTESAPVAVVMRLLLYVRRLRVVQLVLTLGLAVGAVALVTVLSAAALPLLLFAAGAVTILTALRSRRVNECMRGALGGAHIRVLIPPRGRALMSGRPKSRMSGGAGEHLPFFVRQAYAMAAEAGVRVVVVSPYLFSCRGLGGRGAYFTARQEADGVYLVRRPYYFLLRRQVLDALDADMTVIY